MTVLHKSLLSSTSTCIFASPKAEVTEDDDDDDISKLVPVPVPAVAPLHPALAAQGYTSPQPSTLPSAALRARRGGSVRGGPEAG